jgi:hypothetical protein
MNVNDVNMQRLKRNRLDMAVNVLSAKRLVSTLIRSAKGCVNWLPTTLHPLDAFESQEGDEKKIAPTPQLVQTFQHVVEGYTAGFPNDDQERWVGLHPGQIRDKMAQEGVEISRYIASALLKFCGFRKRRYAKTRCLGHHENRDAQFQKIAHFQEAFAARGLPILSIDTKKKEPLGHFDRGDHYYGRELRRVNDHDFASASTGIVIPYGIYDVVRDHGYLTLGISKDTSEFVSDNLRWYWQQELQWQYPEADAILLLCDGGGSNNCRHHLVKWDLLQFAQDIGIDLVVAHYPAYCSKWNPIEHRFFCHLQRAWDGAIFHTIDLVKELALTTSTQTGLTVSVRMNSKRYVTGRTLPEASFQRLNEHILFDDEIPQWNYVIKAYT